MRVRIWCTIANISSSLDHAPSSIPYKASAFGVLPPLWSSAAMKPGCDLIFCSCRSFKPIDFITLPSIVDIG
jgi:hypothetical protein